MRKLLFVLISTFIFSNIFSQSNSDYKISEFIDFGWYYCAIINKSNITLTCYANQNSFHKSGSPVYILQGILGTPDKRNLTLGEGDPGAGVYKFKVLYYDPAKKGIIPEPGTVWYKVNKLGKDRLEFESGEATLSIIIAK